MTIINFQKPIRKQSIGFNKSNIWVMIAFALTVLACQNQPSEQKTATASTTSNPNKTQTVGVISPSNSSFNAESTITGTAMPNQKVTLYAMESGYVKSIRAEIGDKVNKGAFIASLNNPIISSLLSEAEAKTKISAAELSTAEAELIAAEADAKVKTSIYERLNGIYQKTPQLTTIMDVENAAAAANIAKANIATKQANVQAQKSKIEAFTQQAGLAKQRHNKLTITAPFTGVITRRMIDAGAMVQSGLTEDNPKGIVEIQETNPIRLTIPMPESDATTIKKGMEVLVTFPELIGESFRSKISRMAGALDPTSKTMQVEIDIPNPDGKILTGMYAKVQMQLGSREDVLSLPMIAKVLYKDAPHALIVKDGIVERIPLRIGLSGKNYFEVLNSEITKETKVIIQGKGLVKPGQTVEAKMVSM